jgi:hypothetical protein
MTTHTAPAAGTDYAFTTYAKVDFCTRPRRVNNAYVIPRSASDFKPCDWTCWLCHGNNTGTASVTTTEKVARVDFFADNSVEVVSVTGRRATHVSPNGDACF